MKTIAQSITLAAMIAASSAAQANVVTYDFTETITSMSLYDGITKLTAAVSSSSLPGFLVSNGDKVHGTFSFDESAAHSSYQPAAPAQGSYVMYQNGAGTGTFTFDKIGMTVEGTSSNISVVNNASNFLGWDAFSTVYTATYSPVKFQNISLYLYDSTATVFNSASIPTALSLSAFSYAKIEYLFLRQSDGSQMRASGNITSLSKEAASAVPEPEAYAMMLAGLGLMGFMVRRRKAS